MEGAKSQTIEQGILLKARKKGAKPVLADQAELIANSIVGNFATQSFWFWWMHCQSICVTVQLACSVAPLD